VSEILIWAGVVFATVVVVLGIIYIVFGKGLAFRIFSLLTPTIGTIGIVGVIAGKITLTAFNMFIVLFPSASLTIIILYYLYRITVVDLRKNALELQANSAQLSATSSQSASTAAEQAGIVSQVSSTIEEMAQTSAAGAKNAQQIVTVTSEAVSQGQEGQASIQEVLSIVTRIGRVNRIVDAVNQLAEQSNLLAVNAGIEAAKAGEQGRGFSVVASEVRNLAERTRRATSEIRDALELTDAGRKALESTHQAVEQLVVVLEDASDRSRQIAAASMQQSAGIKEINEAILSLNQASQDNTSASGQIKQAVHNLETISDRIERFVGGKRAPEAGA
jgi:methyl-accepting chemotaxis protein